MLNTQVKLHAIVLLWGFTGIIGKLISVEAMPLVFWRTAFATLCIFLFLKFLNVSIQVTRKQFFYYLGIGAITGLHWALFFGAIKVANVSVALSTIATTSLFVAFIEPIFYKRRIDAVEVILSIIIMICLGFIFKASPEYSLGIIMGVGCAFLAALMTVLNGVLQKKPSNQPRVMMLYEMLGAWIVITLIMGFMGQIPNELAIIKVDFVWLLMLGTIFTAYPMIESIRLMRHISPYSLVLAVNLEPIYGIVLAYWIFGESEVMNTTFYIASVVMLVVIIANGIFKSRHKIEPKR